MTHGAIPPAEPNSLTYRTHVQPPFPLCFACDAPSEVLRSGHVPPTMCCVRVSGETEAKCAASLALQKPKALWLTLSGGSPIGRHNTGVRCLLSLSNVQQRLLEPPNRDICFPDPVEGSRPRQAAGRAWMPAELTKGQLTFCFLRQRTWLTLFMLLGRNEVSDVNCFVEKRKECVFE